MAHMWFLVSCGNYITLSRKREGYINITLSISTINIKKANEKEIYLYYVTNTCI